MVSCHYYVITQILDYKNRLIIFIDYFQSPQRMIQSWKTLLIMLAFQCGLSLICNDANCQSCASTALYNCQACSVGFNLKNGTCCSTSQSNCLSCTTSASVCSQCVSDSYVLDAGWCKACSAVMGNCATCSSTTTCLTCVSNSYVVSSNLCAACSSLMTNCGTCSSASVCLSCLTSNYAISSNLCVACSSLITNCGTCSSASTCLTCISTAYALTSNQCLACSGLLSHCATCSSDTTCLSCVSTSYGLVYNICESCSILIPNCATCISSTTCITCATAEYAISANLCIACTNLMTGCKTCASSAVCSGCVSTEYFLNGGTFKCDVCSSTIPNCKNCSSSTVCTTCNDNTFALNSANQCSTCASVMSGCSTCSSTSVCLSCVDSTMAINPSTNKCQACPTFLPNCYYCSSSTVCTLCVNSNYLVNLGNCVACSSMLSNCQTCTSSTVCTACTSSNYALSSGTCTLCSNFLTGCATCASISVCTSCQNNQFVFNVSKCEPCISSLSNCLTCSSSSFCLTCLTNTFTTVSGVCVSCPSLMTNCLRCSSPTVCVACTTAFGVNLTTHKCDTCPTLIPNCVNCASSSLCTLCNSNTLYVDANGKCATCLSKIPNCLTCSSSTMCTSCTTDLLAASPSSGQCQVCGKFMSSCTKCFNSTICTYCIVSPNIILNNSRCVPCSAVIPSCLHCTKANYCTLCGKYNLLVYSYPNSSSCAFCGGLMAGCIDCTSKTVCTLCLYGSKVIGGCSAVYGCRSVIQKPPMAVCTSCDPAMFKETAINGVCECKVGHLAGKYCTQIAGCALIQRMVSGDLCIKCSQANNFYYKDGECRCLPFYELKGSKCSDICGDGVRLTLPCDDGNLISGDGCSSTCQIEPKYTCHGANSNSTSICVFKGQVNLELVCVNKLEDNTAQIQLSLNPYVPNIHKSNSSLSFSFPTRNCSMSYYQMVGPKIFIYISYHQDIQGSYANVDLKFDGYYIESKDAFLTIQMKQCSGDVLSYEPISKSSKEVIMLIASLLSYSVLLVWLVGSYSHKMIGVETLHTFQSMIITQVFAKRYYPVFKYFNKLTSTLNIFQNNFASSGSLASNQFNRLNYAGDFLYNFGFIGLAQLFISIIFIVFKCLKGKEKVTYSPQKQGIQQSCIGKASKYKDILYNFLVFPLFIGFYPNLVISLMIHFSQSSPKVFASTHIQKGAILFVAITTNILFFSEWKEMLIRNKDNQKQNYSQKYIAAYLTKLFILSFLTAASLFGTITYPLYVLGVLTSIYTVFIIIYRPYQSLIHNISIIVNQIGMLLNFGWLISQNYIVLTKIQEEKIAIAMISWMVLIIFLAALRTVFQLRKKMVENAKEEVPRSTLKKPSQYEREMQNVINVLNEKNINSFRIQSQLLRDKQLGRANRQKRGIRQLDESKTKIKPEGALRTPLKQ